jgi:vitamin B12 transporter
MFTRLNSLVRLGTGLAAGALLAASGIANAQTVLPELVVVSPSLVPIEASKSGSSVTAMTGEEARASGFSQLSDVMRTFAGMHVNQSGPRGSLTQFRVRGAEANHLLVMIDGVPANAVGDGEFNFADIPMDDIERVELLRGPQSGIYGANAHSGVLTIITKSGRGLTKPEFTARFEGGTQKSAEAAATFRGAVGPVYGSITAVHGTTNGFNVARDGNEPDGAKRTAVTAKAGVDLSQNVNIEGFLRHVRRGSAYDPQDFFNGLLFDSPGFYVPLEQSQARIEGTVKLFDDRWIQSFKWTGSRTNTGNIENFQLAGSSLGTANTLTYKSTLLLDSDVMGGEKHRITGFLENRQENFSFFSNFLFGADADAARNGFKRTSTGVGGEYLVDLLRTGTTLSAAVRQDFNDPFQDELTWRFTVSQKVAPIEGRLHASVGRGVTNPSFFEQFGFISTFFTPNPNLVPESSIGWDAGWEQTFWNGRVVIDVTYFNSRLEHEIVSASTKTGIPTVRNLDGQSTRQGVETTAKFKPVDWLILSGTYTYTDARDDKGIEEIRRPPHAASASATVLFDGGRGKVSANFVYNGRMKDTIFTFPSQTTTLAAYTLVAGQISYDMTPWSTIYVRGENVFDQRYEEVYSFRAPGAGVYAGVKVRTN